MTKKISGYLERTPALTILGGFLSNYYNGLILILFITFLTFSLLVNSGFNLFTGIFTIFFSIPVFLFAHFRLVMRGRKAMKKGWHILIDTEAGTLMYDTGYPNIVKPKTMELKIDDITRIILKGNETFGYFLEFETLENLKKMKKAKTPKERLRIERFHLGLWRHLDDAKNVGKQVSDLIGKPLEEILEKN